MSSRALRNSLHCRPQASLSTPNASVITSAAQPLRNMTDEQLDAAIDAVKQMLESRAASQGAVIDGRAETIALPAPAELERPQRKRPNRLLEHADTAIGPRERKPRKRVPSPGA
jgi:hypothetical protein